MTGAAHAELSVLEGDNMRVERPTTGQRAADILRTRILEGELRAGTQFAEQRLAAILGVSRNTLREAFQILIAEHLVVHEPHRGVFVRRITAPEVSDIYAFRRLVECAALTRPLANDHVAQMQVAVDMGGAAAARLAWDEVGTADLRFHLAVVAAAGSQRLDQAVRVLFAELRLAFQLVADPAVLHAPFLVRNAEILTLVQAGAHEQAATAMRSYLDAAESLIIANIPAR
jgi:DNA-binding GntR family transcriptional regulator